MSTLANFLGGFVFSLAYWIAVGFVRDLFPWRLKPASTEQMDEIHRAVQKANLEDIRNRGLDVVASGDVTIEADTEADDVRGDRL